MIIEEDLKKKKMEAINYVLQKWEYVEDLETVINMITFRMDMVICGPPGCGKTTFVEEICKINEIMPTKVNCIEHYNTTKLIGRLGKTFKEDLGLGSNISSSSLDRIIYSLNFEPDIMNVNEINKIANQAERDYELSKREEEMGKSNFGFS